MTVALQPASPDLVSVPVPRRARRPPGQHAVPRPGRGRRGHPLPAAGRGAARHRAPLRRQGQPRPGAAGGAGRGRAAGFDVASPAEVRAALDAGRGPGDLVYSNPVKRRDDIAVAARARRRGCSSSTRPRRSRKVAEAAPGSAVLCRIVTSGTGSDWPLSRKYGCSDRRGGRDPAAPPPRLGLDAGRRLLPRRLAAARPAGLGRARSRRPPRVFAALRADGLDPWLLDLGGGFPAPLEGGCPPLDGVRRGDRAAAAPRASATDRPQHARRARSRRSSPTPATLVTTVVAVRRTAATPAGCSSTPASSPAWSRPSTRRSATGSSQPDVPGRPGRACSPGRPATAPTCSTSSVPVQLPLALAEGDRVRLHVGRRLHHLLLDGRLQRLRAAADRARRLTMPAMGPGRPRRRRCCGARAGGGGDVAAVAAAAAAGLGAVRRQHRRACCSGWPARPGCCRTSRCPGRPARLGDRFRRDRIVRATRSPGWCSWASSRWRSPRTLLVAVVAATAAVAAGTPAYPALAAAMPAAAGRRPRRRATDPAGHHRGRVVRGRAGARRAAARARRPRPALPLVGRSSARWRPCCWCTGRGCRARSGPPGRRGPGRCCGRRGARACPGRSRPWRCSTRCWPRRGWRCCRWPRRTGREGTGRRRRCWGSARSRRRCSWRLGGSPGARARAGLVLLAAALAALPLSPRSDGLCRRWRLPAPRRCTSRGR